MRKIIGFLFFFALFGLVFAGGYVMPAKDLIVSEMDANGKIIDKKVAEQNEVSYSREVRTVALLDATGITGYKATFSISLKNVSGAALDDVSLIEQVPAAIAADANAIKSDSVFIVLDKEPVIKFFIGAIPSNSSASVSYFVEFGKEKKDAMEAVFGDLNSPVVLIPAGANTCVGRYCNDFNPCTTDYCTGGTCVYENAVDGVNCGQDLVCYKGTCGRFRNPEMWYKLGIAVISVVMISVILLFIRGEHRKNKKAAR